MIQLVMSELHRTKQYRSLYTEPQHKTEMYSIRLTLINKWYFLAASLNLMKVSKEDVILKSKEIYGRLCRKQGFVSLAAPPPV